MLNCLGTKVSNKYEADGSIHGLQNAGSSLLLNLLCTSTRLYLYLTCFSYSQKTCRSSTATSVKSVRSLQSTTLHRRLLFEILVCGLDKRQIPRLLHTVNFPSPKSDNEIYVLFTNLSMSTNFFIFVLKAGIALENMLKSRPVGNFFALDS